MKRKLLGFLSAVSLVAIWAPQSAFADGTVGVLMPCSDPNGSVSVTTDQATASGIDLAVQGMADSPAGMSCSVTETAVPTVSTPHAFAVGGGQFLDGCGSATFAQNFAFDAHTDGAGNVRGTINVTWPANPCFPVSHETATVTCLVISGNSAAFSGPITNADGAFVNNQFIEGHATDNGNPQNGQPVDSVALYGAFHDPGCPVLTGQFPLTKGNLVVRQAS